MRERMTTTEVADYLNARQQYIEFTRQTVLHAIKRGRFNYTTGKTVRLTARRGVDGKYVTTVEHVDQFLARLLSDGETQLPLSY